VPEAVWLWAAFFVVLGAAGLSPNANPVRRAASRPTLTVTRSVLFVALVLLGPLAWASVVSRPSTEAVTAAAVPVSIGATVSVLLLWRLALTARVAQRQRRRLAQRTRSLAAANQHQRRLEQQLRHQATHDSLTGLANRSVLRQGLGNALDRGVFPLVLLLLDLDGFKQANDTRGHVVGDEVLIHVAQRLRTVLPPSATIARLGGDEFAALIPDADASAGLRMADRVCAQLRHPYPVGTDSVELTTSVGVLGMRPTSPAWTPTEALRCADIAMYAAKSAGGDTHVLYAG
jgi:diguanylate cyclase